MYIIYIGSRNKTPGHKFMEDFIIERNYRDINNRENKSCLEMESAILEILLNFSNWFIYSVGSLKK